MQKDFNYTEDNFNEAAEFENDAYLDEEQEEEFDENKYSEGDIITEKEIIDGETVIKTYELVYDYENDCLVKEPVKKDKKKEKPKDDWKSFGFNKKYEGTFSLEKAYALYFDFDDENNLKETSQREAICYATYFAKNNDNDAKNFIICDVINKESTWASRDIGNYAFESFYLFFRNYVRKITESHYNALPMKTPYDRIKDGENHLWLHIYQTLRDFDPSIAKINTFYSFKRLNDELQNFDILQTGQQISKPTYISFSKVATVIKEIENNKRVATIDAVTMLYNEKYNDTKKPEAIKNAMDYLTMQNTMINIDSEEGTSVLETHSQGLFEEPEKAYIKKEKDVSISSIINSLTKLQRDILLSKYGMGISADGRIYDMGIALNTKQLAQRFNVSEEVIEREYKIAQNVFRNAYPKESGVDKHLIGRAPIFTDMANDFDLEEFLSMVDDIEFEDIDGEFTKIDSGEG